MNDERSLVKQIKWLKQEINNLKIASEKGLGAISPYLQKVIWENPSPKPNTSWGGYVTIKAKILEGDITNFFAIIGTGEQEGLVNAGNLELNQIDNSATWQALLSNFPSNTATATIIVLSTLPCELEVRSGI